MAQIKWNLIKYWDQFAPFCSNDFHHDHETTGKERKDFHLFIRIMVEEGWKLTNLVTIVPPVANAVMNRNAQNSQYHGANAVAMPEKSWMKTAATNGPRRPNLCKKREKRPKWQHFVNFFAEMSNCAFETYLSASVPNKILPTKMPNMKMVCDAFAKCFRWHTKSHVICNVSVNTDRS